MIDSFMKKGVKKVTVLQVQKLCGFLNFLCRCILPGRAFLRRLYTLTANPKLKQHHHVRLNQENKLDLGIWRMFLTSSNIFCRSFMNPETTHANEIDMYSDVSGKIGFGAICERSWMYGEWDRKLIEQEPSIEYLELYALTAGVLTWIHRFKNSKIALFCDNMGVIHMVNNMSSKCGKCMVLIRLLVLEGLRHNVKIKVKYVNTKENGKSDALSRMEFKRFFRLGGPNVDPKPTELPKEIWPVSKIWFK